MLPGSYILQVGFKYWLIANDVFEFWLSVIRMNNSYMSSW